MKYDTKDCDPPAPVVDVKVFRPNARNHEVGRGRLDTGADMTVIPLSWVRRLRILPSGIVTVFGYDASGGKKEIYPVRIEFGRFQFPTLEVLASNREDALIGRDILNRLNANLNGKKFTFELADP